MAHANVTPEEVLRKILNKVSDEENDDIEDIVSLASGDEVDVMLSTSFNFGNPDDVNGADKTSQVIRTMQVILQEPHTDVSLPAIDQLMIWKVLLMNKITSH